MIEENDIKVGLVFELSTDLCKKKEIVGTYTVKDFCVHDGKTYIVYESDGMDFEVPLGAFLTNEYSIDNMCLVASYPEYDRAGIRNELYAETYINKVAETRRYGDCDMLDLQSDDFKAITDKMCSTYAAKNHDYGNSFHDLFKECGMVYAYGHLAEKLHRIKSLMKDENKVKGESMADSLHDLANYAVLTLMELNAKDKRI